MKALMTAGLLVAAFATAGRAQEASASYGGGINYTDLDSRGSRGQVQEYDGKLYDRPTGEIKVSNQGAQGLIDLDFNDIGSAEESALLHADYKDTVKVKAFYDRMTHRQNMTDFGVVINGVFVKIPTNLAQTLIPADLNMQYKRTEIGASVAFFVPGNSARWLSLDYWSALKKGTTPSGYYTGGILFFREANVDNTTREFVLGLGREATERGALSLDIIRRDFKEEAQVIRFNGGVTAVKPPLPNIEMTGGDFRFRYDPSKKLALTGALTGRQRTSLFNQYRVNSGVAALNASYKPSATVGVTGRLYGRYSEVDEDAAYRNVVSNSPAANKSQIDLLNLRGELSTTWQAHAKVRVTGAYKMDMAHRRDAPSEIFGSAGYTDGTFIISGQHANSVANDVVKHFLTAKVSADLPLDARLDADYQRLQANRAAFVNQPTRSDAAGATLNLPLPARVEMYLSGEYAHERNDIHFTRYSQTRNAYRAGLDWEAADKVFVGADASYETARYFTEGWFGASGGSANPALSGLIHVGGMYNRQNSATFGLHGRVNLPKGFTVKGSGSYTRSHVMTPLNYNPVTDPGQFLGDETPGDVRIARGRAGVEYTPPGHKNLTARAGYRVDHWVDKYDANNSGRVSYTEVGLSAKF